MSKRLTLPEQKAQRIAVAATVAGVLVVVVLAVFLVIQFVKIGELNRRKAELEESKKVLTDENAELTEQKERLESPEVRYFLALKEGWRSDK